MKTTIYMKKNLFLITGFIFTILYFSGRVNFSFGVELLPFDTILANEYKKSQEKNYLKEVGEGYKFGNIYSSIREKIINEGKINTDESATSVMKTINSHYNCDMRRNEVVSIMTNTPEILTQIKRLVGSNAIESNGLFVASCTKLAKCLNRQGLVSGFDDKVVRSENYTFENFFQCRNMITQTYEKAKERISFYNAMKNINGRDDLLQNGNSADSPFDILIDIENIANLMFVSNKKANEISLYSTVQRAGDPGDDFRKNLGDLINKAFGNQPAGGHIEGENSPTDNVNKPIRNSGSGTIVEVSGTGSIDRGSLERNLGPDLLNFIGEINITQIPTSTNSSGTTTGNNTGNIVFNDPFGTYNQNVINNFSCIPQNQTPSKENRQRTTEEETAETYQYNTFNDQEKILNNILDQHSRIGNSSVGSSSGGNTGTQSKREQAQIAITNFLNNNFDLNDVERTKSCLANCANLGPLDTVTCSSKCLCGTVSSKDEIFRIKYCMIPAHRYDITQKNSFFAVEEIIDELFKHFQNISNEGTNIAHDNQKGNRQFLSIGLKNFKFNKLLAFNFIIGFKPLYKNRLASIEKEKAKVINAKAEEIIKEQTQNSATTKNKYTLMRNNEGYETSSQGGNDLDDFFQNKMIADSQKNALLYNEYLMRKNIQQSTQIESMNLVEEFIGNNISFWNQVAEVMNAMVSTSTEFSKRVEKGKNF